MAGITRMPAPSGANREAAYAPGLYPPAPGMSSQAPIGPNGDNRHAAQAPGTYPPAPGAGGGSNAYPGAAQPSQSSGQDFYSLYGPQAAPAAHSGAPQPGPAAYGGNYAGQAHSPEDLEAGPAPKQQGKAWGGNGAQAPPPAHAPPADHARPMQPLHTEQAAPHPHGAHSAAEAKWNADIRRAFTRKVLFIVFCQLLITTGISLLFYLVDPIRLYVQQNQWVIIASWALAFGVLIFMSCSTRARRKFPINYIFLIVFTLIFSVMTGAITANYNVQAVGIALAVTAATVGGAFFVARFTKLDLTKYGGFLMAILIGVIVMSIIAIFWRNKWWYFAIAIISAILFTAFLIYDLQLLMGGGARELSPDEYIFAAVNIYLDIVQIFLNILRIVGFAQSM